MKRRTLFLMGFILSLVTMLVIANNIEGGDINAMSMYFVVFLIPLLLLAAVNTFYISFVNSMSNQTLTSILSFGPVVLLGVLSLTKSLSIPGLDGNFILVVRVAAIALGITNLIWLIGRSVSKSI